MPHQLPTACAVNLGSLIQLYIHAGQRRQIDDGAVAGLFPDILADDQRGEQLGVAEQVGRLGTENLCQNVVDGTVGGGEHLESQRRHNDDGDKVGDVDQRLRCALEPFAAQLI